MKLKSWRPQNLTKSRKTASVICSSLRRIFLTLWIGNPPCGRLSFYFYYTTSKIFCNKNHWLKTKCFLLKICLHDTILQTTVLQGGFVASFFKGWRWCSWNYLLSKICYSSECFFWHCWHLFLPFASNVRIEKLPLYFGRLRAVFH